MIELKRGKVPDPRKESHTTVRGIEEVNVFLGIKESDLRNKDILDLGSGNAHVAQGLSGKAKVYSIDAYLTPVEPHKSPGDSTPRYGKEAYENAKSRAVIGLAEQLPFKEESFDYVLALFSVPFHSPDEIHLEQALREVVRVLKPNGEARLGPVHMEIKDSVRHSMQNIENIIGKIPNCNYEIQALEAGSYPLHVLIIRKIKE